MPATKPAAAKPTDKVLLNFIVHVPLLERIDDFRFRNRFPNRAEAIKWLLDHALTQNPKPKPEGKLSHG